MSTNCPLSAWQIPEVKQKDGRTIAHVLVGVCKGWGSPSESLVKSRRVQLLNFARLECKEDTVSSLLDAAALYGSDVFHYVADMSSVAVIAVEPHWLHLKLSDSFSRYLGFYHSSMDTITLLPKIWLCLPTSFLAFETVPFSLPVRNRLAFRPFPETFTCTFWQVRKVPEGWNRFIHKNLYTLVAIEAILEAEEEEKEERRRRRAEAKEREEKEEEKQMRIDGETEDMGLRMLLGPSRGEMKSDGGVELRAERDDEDSSARRQGFSLGVTSVCSGVALASDDGMTLRHRRGLHTHQTVLQA
eukprot:TRINITY_DN7865_c0_g2_i1.p1 TRINITY_DN7865_c0_g2~~TRINITY_DN7865_c0_g2_i1.p1  ORF type:complete len:301 (+),score=27.09 TRINITY_DN7865_c0_g2_i1:448-1350(+)